MKKSLLLSFIFVFALVVQVLAQSRTVTGKVTDQETGQGLPGVTVLVKGTSIGTATGVDGGYSISIPSDNAVLVFRYVGYETVEKAVGNAATVNIGMGVSSKQLGEVIVTGYGTTSEIANTGAVVQVNAADIENVPMTSFDKALQGRVPGLQSVGASGQPGSAQEIRIRGIGSISASSAPLYVIDGVPINSGDLSRNTTTANALAGINPNDIESITVLKDASAASIYGSRAANGVIVVTTKNGKAGKTRVRVDAEGGVSKRAYFNENTRPLTTEENMELAGEALLNHPVYGPIFAGMSKRDAAIAGFGFNPDVNTNWYDEVSQTGSHQQYNLAIDGGSDKTQFRVSGGYFDQEGTIKTSAFERINGGLNLNHRASDKVSFGTNLIASSSTQSGPLNSGFFSNPVMSSLFVMPDYAAYTEEGEINYFGGLYNPLGVLEQDERSSNMLKTIGSVNGAYEILPNLKFTSKFGIDFNSLEEDTYQSPNYGDGEGVGYATRYYTRYFNWVWTNLVDYNWNITSDNNWVATVKAGYEAQKSTYYSANVTNSVMPLNTDFIVPGVGSTPLESGGTNTGYTFESMLALGDISYKGKYILSGSYRRDGSSRFSEDNRYGNFWSVGASWNVDQEEFMQSVSWVDQLKLRASYGVNGNAGIGNYTWRPLYSYGYNYAGLVGSAPQSIGNENLTWEKNKPLDIGMDISLFEDRLNITAEYYTRETSDLLLNTPLSRTTGWTTYLDNIGAMKNSGYELAISGTPLVVGDFRWDLSFNITKNKNEILELAQDGQVVSPFYRKVGKDYQTFYLPLWAGVDPATGNPQWYKDETRTEKTSSWSQAKRVDTGKSASPKAFGSFGTTMSWKGLSLDALFYYNVGNYLYDPYYQYLNSGGAYIGSYNQRATELNRWQNPGDITNVPRYVYGGTNSYRLSDRILNSGDFVRLRDISLSYNLPESVIGKAKLSSAKVYVRGTNMWTWAKDENLPYDPEAGGVGGLTNFDIEVPKTMTVGVSIGI